MSTNSLFGHLYMSLHVQFSNLDILFQNSRPKFVIFDQAAIFLCKKITDRQIFVQVILVVFYFYQ